MAIKFSILLSLSMKSLVKANRVVFLVNFPLKAAYYKSHLSIRHFKASLFSTLKEQRKLTDSKGLFIIIRAQTKTNP